MRKLSRPALEATTFAYLASETTTVASASDPKAAAAQRWAAKNREHFKHVRRQLEVMASGRVRCMYCDDSGGTDIDHFAPKGTYPDRCFIWTNYLLACSHCNSNEKRTQYPLDRDGNRLLIDPSVDDPLEHLALIPATGEFASKSAKGAASIEVFALNRAILSQGRVDAWNGASALIRQYAQSVDSDNALAAMYSRALSNASFSVVLLVMHQYASSPGDVLPAEVRLALSAHPELTSWL